ncbi:hypothetical protein D0A61_22805 (plasmid) [Pantoea agglomerans]|nr:hypothetical protein D0A61_22805 [Pantoea agglomerans]
MQLSQGEYNSVDTYANNLFHLNNIFNTFSSYIDDLNFLAWLKKHDPVMTSEIVMTGRLLMSHYNFFRVSLMEHSRE